MRKKVLTVLGDFYHDVELSRTAIDEAMQPYITGGQIELRHITVDEIEEALSDPVRPDVVILFKEDRLNPEEPEVKRWMTAQLASAITRYVENGGSWIAWHSGLASYDEGEGREYLQMLRGYFKHHPRDHQIIHYTPAAGSSIAGSAVPFDVIDEQYFVHCEEQHTEVFLRSESETDGKSIAGWSHEYGQGRVCCLTPAHRREGLFHPSMSHLLRQSVKWCCKG